MSRLPDAAGAAPFIFVVGKGGVGKTTTAGALALELADTGHDTHLISTDPAHSLADVFQHPVGGDVVTSSCSPRLRIEEFDAARMGDAWLGRALGPVSEIVEQGTYLDAEDVGAFSRLALPGLDEMMAVLRLADLAGGSDRIVVDTAPTGHTLRLLDAAATHAGIARALRAMADKAAAVAGALTGRSVRLAGESIIEELDRYVETYQSRVLRPAAFIVITKPGTVVAAETDRLVRELEARQLSIAAVVATGGAADLPTVSAVQLEVPVLTDVTGCSGLRAWREHVQNGRNRMSGPGPQPSVSAPAAPLAGAGAVDWLATNAPRLLLFAGKGGVGKSTCAAAVALALAASRWVLLCSTDPAGSLDDVLGTGRAGVTGRLRIAQIDPAAQLRRLRDAYEEEIVAALERVGLSQSAALDRAVIAALWDLAPPGLDELAATAAMLGTARTEETIVIDAAPTGHFLRLLEMPDVALGWTRQLMRIIVKYGIAGTAGGAAESLLDLSRELRALRDQLHDAESAFVIVVTLDEPVVRAETDRLLAALAETDIRVGALLLNRTAEPAAARDRADSSDHAALMIAPELSPPPIGPDALRGFIDMWNIVA